MAAALTLLLPTIAARLALADDSGSAPMKDEARVHLERGLSWFERKEYEKAIEEFTSGYAIDARPEFLFAMGQAHRLDGHCEAAIPKYDEFLRTKPPEEQARRAEAGIERCRPESARSASAPRAEPSSAPEREPAAPGAVVSAPPIGAKTDTLPRRAAEGVMRPWYTDPLGNVLAVTGVVAMAAGGVSLAIAAERSSATGDATVIDDFDARRGLAETSRTVGYVCLAVGGSAFLGGLVRYATRSRRTPASVAIVLHSGGSGIVAKQSF